MDEVNYVPLDYTPTNEQVARWGSEDKVREFMRERVYGGFVNDKMLPVDQLQSDDEGNVSFSEAIQTKLLIQTLDEYFWGGIARDKREVLMVTDAGAGCGCDTLEFMAAVDQNGKRIQMDVCSVEIDKVKADMLTANTKCLRKNLIEQSKNKVSQSTCKVINDDYMLIMDELEQDIVYLDPPWYNYSSVERARHELHLKNKKGQRYPDGYGVDKILEKLLFQNRQIDKNEKEGILPVKRKTKILVLKTPTMWIAKMLGEMIRMEGLAGTRMVPTKKYDYLICFLCRKEYENMKDKKRNFTKIEGYETWRQQQEHVKEWFDVGSGFFSVEAPIFLQNIWEDADDDNQTKRIEKKQNYHGPKKKNIKTHEEIDWNIKCTQMYIPGALHDKTNLHNGEKKLLESSLFTILYGIERTRRAWQKIKGRELITWNDVLTNTIVLYIGAAGLKEDSHHFKELFQAIPTVHFACYDIRKIKTGLTPEYNNRMTVFHKIFTNVDLARWIAFCNKYTNKSVIVISDIRSEWDHARMEMEASKKVALAKMKLIFMARHSDNDNLNEKAVEARKDVTKLFAENRAIAKYVENIVQNDNYVQWLWFSTFKKECKNCAIYSAKTREPYQTAENIHDSYIHFPGAELLQSATRSSTETRTQITSTVFEIIIPEDRVFERINERTGKSQTVTLKIKDWPAKKCLDAHFKSFGDQSSFVTEYIDYAYNYPKEATPECMWLNYPTRKIHLHDMKFAWYNSDFQQTHQKKAVDDIIKEMYANWKKSYFGSLKSETIVFDLEKWLNEKRQDMEKVDKHIHRSYESKIPLDLMIRGDNEEMVTNSINALQFSNLNLKKVKRYLSSSAALFRYENHLRGTSILERNKLQVNSHDRASHNNSVIWDISQSALETLLILNLNMGSDPKRGAAQLMHHHSRNGNAVKHWSDKMPWEWVVSQLRFNLINPFAGSLHRTKTRGLELRYNLVADCLMRIAVNNNYPLLYYAGSCTSPQQRMWIHRLVPLYKGGLDLARDWYCYWLQALLENVDGSDLKYRVGEAAISAAVSQYMLQGMDGVLLRMDGTDTTSFLELHKWPMGKPVLYYSCEKGCLGMVQFCLKGLSLWEQKRRVNTPRMRIKRSAYVASMDPNADETKLQDMKFAVVAENYPLHIAAYNGHANVVRFLLGLGADPDALNWYGQGETALQCAEYSHSTTGHDQQLAAKIGECMQILKDFKAAVAARVEYVLPVATAAEDDGEAPAAP